MKFFFNDQHQIDFEFDHRNETVQDFLTALDVFLTDNPLGCEDCPPDKNCCQQDMLIPADSVFLRSNGQGDLPSFIYRHMDTFGGCFIRNDPTGDCPWLSLDDRCEIHEKKPLACRLYQCANQASDRYLVLERTFEQALVEVARADTLFIQFPGGRFPAREVPREEYDKEYGLDSLGRTDDYSFVSLYKCLQWGLTDIGIQLTADRLLDEEIVDNPHLRRVPNELVVRKLLMAEMDRLP